MLTLRRIVFLSALGLALAAAGCGGDSSPPPPPPPISVSISPLTASVFLGATQQFTATVSNTSNTGVTWAVNGITGGDASVGTISTAGLYTAPQNLPTNPQVTVRAVSQADPSKSASATVTVQSDLAVSLTPGTASVELGATQQFTANVTGSGNPNRNVTWSVSGAGCSGSACGTIDSAGLYTAAQILPSPASVTIRATSVADTSKSGSATATITSNFTLSVSGPSSVDNGASATFTATLNAVPGSNPSPSVSWSVSCTGDCGTIDGTGLYTAPLLAPSPNAVRITATSLADSTKTASQDITVNALVVVYVSPAPASVELENTQQFTASVGGTVDQRVIWDVNGEPGGSPTLGFINNPASGPTSPTTYTAPVNMPTPGEVTVRATSQFDNAKSATSTVTLFSTIAVSVSPSSSKRAVRHRQTFLGQVTNTSNLYLEWQVNGDPGGNDVVGKICVLGITPCWQISEDNTGSVDYEAPASVPGTNPVTITAISLAHRSRMGSAMVEIIPNVLVSVSPKNATVPQGGVQQFTATVEGTSDQRVTWSVSGTSCDGSPCGTVDNFGLYSAPASAPPSATDTVIATSEEDGDQSGTGTVTIATGPFIQKLLPASITAGAATTFTLKVQGINFAITGSVILFDGAEKSTTCTSFTECTTQLSASDVATPGGKSVQVKKLGPPVEFSNQVALVVVPAVTTEDVIELTASTPSATGIDIYVVEPTTAGTSAAGALNIESIGFYSGGSCLVSGKPIAIVRPPSGHEDTHICVLASNADASATFTISGPTPSDITISNVQPQGIYVFSMTLTLLSTTQPGARTVFVTTAAKDKAAATGAIEVKLP